MSKSVVKTMLTDFFDNKGVAHEKFVPQGQTVTAAYYVYWKDFEQRSSGREKTSPLLGKFHYE